MTSYVFDIETNGLSGMKNRITCISILNITSNEITTFIGKDEIKILNQFWEAISHANILYGFNSDAFDIKFLIQRSLINSVQLPFLFKNIKFIDLRKISSGFWYSYNKFEKGTLNDWAKILMGIEKENDGKEMIEAYEKEDFEKIKKHCELDVIMTKKLYDRIKYCNLL